MSISDCIVCWDTPCLCGWGYRYYAKKNRIDLAASVLGVNLKELTKLMKDLTPEDHPMKKVTDCAEAKWSNKDEG